jgi:hypothetical protein
VTTVVCRDGELAADTQCTGDITLRVQKVFRLPDGGVVGLAGDLTHAYLAAKWLADGEQGEPPKFKGGSLLVLRPDGTIHIADDEFPAVPLLDRMAAIGSGAQAAMVALHGGATAVAAVRAAAKVDPYTSEPVQMLAIERRPRRRKA